MIPMIDLEKDFLEIKDEVIETTIKILKSTKYILGPHVKEFERKLSALHDNSCAIGVASGTDALHLSLASLGIESGDEVITTPFTFFATIECIVYQGAIPIFVDIGSDTMNIDVEKVEEKITEKTKAILPVHLFGLPCNMEKIMELANKYNLFVIEDCAQSLGATFHGKKTGSFGDTGCFSFYPTKNLGCYGDGGAIITNNHELNNKIRILRNHGSRGNYIHEKIGFNSRLDEIHAGILLIKLKRLDKLVEIRRKNASIYNTYLKDHVVCPYEPEGYKHVYHQYTIRSPHRDSIINKLRDENISSVIYYPIPMHLQKALTEYGYKKGDYPVAEKTSSEVLSIPVYPGMTENDIEKVSEVIIENVKTVP